MFLRTGGDSEVLWVYSRSEHTRYKQVHAASEETKLLAEEQPLFTPVDINPCLQQRKSRGMVQVYMNKGENQALNRRQNLTTQQLAIAPIIPAYLES